MYFGDRLRELRLEKKLSQEKLASKANLTGAIIQYLETGLRIAPRLTTLVSIATA